jgi:HAMP domain-containing protein
LSGANLAFVLALVPRKDDPMGQIIVGSVLGLAGAVIGAVVAHLLQRSQARQTIELERAKIFADRRLDAYVQFRRLAEQISARENEYESDSESSAETEQLIGELRDAAIVIDSIGDPKVVIAARRLKSAFDYRAQVKGKIMGPTAEEIRRVGGSVRAYVDAVRTSFGVDPMLWEQASSTGRKRPYRRREE